MKTPDVLRGTVELVWRWRAAAGIDEFVDRLRRRGREATAIIYEGDGHFFRRANELDFLARVEELFARCLGGRSQPLDGDRQPGSTGRVRDATK